MSRHPLPRLAAGSLIAVLAASGVLAQGVAVEGTDTARIRPPTAETFPPYENAGYRLSHGDDGAVLVEVSLEPLGSGAPFPAAAGEAGPPGLPAEAGAAQAAKPPARSGESAGRQQPAAGDTPAASGGEVGKLARRLTAEARRQHAAVSAILGWMARNVADDTALGGNAGLGAAAAAEEKRTAAPAPPSPAGRSTAPGEAACSQPGTAGKGGTSAKPANAAKPDTSPKSGTSPKPGNPAKPAAASKPPAPGDPQAPEAVLARRAGDPVGVARLAVALLAAAGIEARLVRGVVAGVPEPGGAHGPHAWIEVRYPDRGWVFSDPLRHHHYVPATYLRAVPRAAEAQPAEGKTAAPAPGAAAKPPAGKGAAGEGARVLERRDLRKTVDLYPPGAPGVTARRNRPEQLAAALRVVVAGGGRALAVLEGPDGRLSKVLPAGEGVFVGLAGGSYRLEVFPDEGAPVVRQVEVPARERGAVFVRQEAAAGPGAARAGTPPRSGRRAAQAP